MDPVLGITNSTVEGTYDVHVPQDLIDLFQSGLEGMPGTVSSSFDIQTRQYTVFTDPNYADGEPYIVDTFRMLESLVLDDVVEAKQGLIVDTQRGRIAFRHHTAPKGINLAAEWREDSLFMEPVTECVDTNLTLEFRVPDHNPASLYVQNLTLIDNGGSANLDIEHNPDMDMADLQKDPQLAFRAYRVA